MAASIHVSATNILRPGVTARWRVIPNESQLQWTDDDVKHLAVAMMYCALGGKAANLLDSDWTCEFDDGALVVKTKNGIEAKTTSGFPAMKERDGDNWRPRVTTELLESYDRWNIDPA